MSLSSTKKGNFASAWPYLCYLLWYLLEIEECLAHNCHLNKVLNEWMNAEFLHVIVKMASFTSVVKRFLTSNHTVKVMFIS